MATDTTELRLAVDDEAIQEYRLKQIFDKRDAAIETRRKAKLAPKRGGRSRDAVSAYRGAIESYVSAVQTTLNEGNGAHYWRHKQYGHVIVTPPGRQIQRHNIWRLPDGKTTNRRPEPKEIEVVGLRSLFELGDPIRLPFEVTRRDELCGRVTDTYTATEQIDWGILDTMLIDLNNHLDELGLSIQTEQNTTWTV